MVAFFAPVVPYVVPRTMIDAIKHLGLESDLAFCIDAGDGNSFPGGAEQQVTDVSGSGLHFWRGLNSGVEASMDPDFVGVAGQQSSGEYFRAIDAQRLTASDSTFGNTLHKNNAVFTFASWARIAAHDVDFGTPLLGTAVSPGNIGINIGYARASDGNNLIVNQQYGTGSNTIDSGLEVPTNDAWAFAAWSYTEATGAWDAQVNGLQASGSKVYVTPSSSAAGRPPTVYAFGVKAGGYTGDVAEAAMWARALSAAELSSLHEARKAKFGL